MKKKTYIQTTKKRKPNFRDAHLFMLGNFTTLLLQGKKFSIVNPHVCGEIFWRSVGEKKSVSARRKGCDKHGSVLNLFVATFLRIKGKKEK